MRYLRTFATTIFHQGLVLPESALLKNLKREFPLIEKNDPAGKAWSHKNYPGGFTTYGSLSRLDLFSPYFGQLEKKVKKQVDAFVRELKWAIGPRDIEVSAFWLNRMGPQCTHSLHFHPLSVVSGTFYVDLPKGSSGLKFEDPRHSKMMAAPPLKKGSAFLVVQPKSGDLILFESWLKHEVPPQPVPSERLSISFNYHWGTKS